MRTNYSFEPITSLCILEGAEDGAVLLGGTRCGHLIHIRVSYDSITWFAERVGTGHLELFPASSSKCSSAFACCDDNLLKIHRTSAGTEKGLAKEIVWAVDSADASLPSPPIHSVFSIPKDEDHGSAESLLIVAGTRLLLTDLSRHALPVPRTFALGGQPTRIIYSHTWKCIVVAYQLIDRPTLAFLDPDTGAIISTPWDRKSKAPETFASGFGNPGDRVYGLHEWLYKKDGETFPYIVATTKSGSLLICSVIRDHGSRSTSPIKYYTRHRKPVESGPVYSVVSDNERLIYCGGSMLYIDEIDSVQKKLKLVKQHALDSPATSLQVIQGKIHAVTQVHSLEIIDHRSNVGSLEMDLIHTDFVNREATHMIGMGPLANRSPWPLSLLSDSSGGIWGLQTPWGQKNKPLILVFSALLSSSVRRFVRGRCRPAWTARNQTKACFGRLKGTPGSADVFGVSIDGTLRHFSLLTPELTRFLLLIQSLSFTSPTLDPLYPDRIKSLELDLPLDDGETLALHRSHIDGDLLARCLRFRKLDELMAQTPKIFQSYCERLDALEGGIYTRGIRQSGPLDQAAKSQYITLGYEVLDYVLAPVI